MTWDEFIKEVISDRQYPETQNESIIEYIDKEKDIPERRITMGPFRKFNGILYCNAGTIKTNDFNIVDQCLKRIIHVGDLKKDDIVIEYSQGGSYTFYIKESVYTICYSSVISTFKEENV